MERKPVISILLILQKIFQWRLIIILYLMNFTFISLYSWSNIFYMNGTLKGVFNVIIAFLI